MKSIEDMQTKQPYRRSARIPLNASPWILVGSTLILLVVVVVLAVQNNNREKVYMTRTLEEKGAALIKGVEAGAKTGMMGMAWGGQQVQTLLEETARLPDVRYLTITDKDGNVLASSNRNLIGLKLQPVPKRPAGPATRLDWRFFDSGDGQRSFEVYRDFSPLGNGHRWMKGRSCQNMGQSGMGMGAANDWCYPTGNSADGKMIYVGLDPQPFEAARKEDIRNTFVISGVLLLLGMAGFVSLFWMQSYRAAKRSLQDTSAIADEVMTSLPVGLIATDRNGMITFCNRAVEKITGIDLAHARGKAPEAILPSRLCGVTQALDRGESITEQEMECNFSGGRVVPVSITASQIINEEGRFVGKVLILRDLGEVRRLQDEIRRQEKLAAIGGLAAGVAHEIRNPLSSIKGIATYFKAKFEPESHDEEMAGVMIEEVDRLNRVISELLEFARPTELKTRPTDLNALLENSVRLIQKEASSKHIDIELKLSEERLTAMIDADRFSQCLLNIYINALQAMDKGGKLTIETLRGTDHAILIRIDDTGKGIGADDLDRVFDPYFTTKPKGTGLGLAIVYKIVEGHHGQIKVRGLPGEGTRFTIALPAGTDKRAYDEQTTPG